MSKGFSDDDWRSIFQLAQSVLTVPKQNRKSYLESRDSNPEIAREALALAEQLEESEEESSSRIGTSIGRFQIIEYLGTGGVGEVFLAQDPDLRRKVAIKVLRQEQSSSREASERFIREARTASALNHPNIVTIHEIIRTEPNLAIVMEFVEGQPLRQLCGRPLELPILISIAQQTADALAAAHEAGIVHRDIKPENVMLMKHGRVKVLDFGLARLTPAGDDTSNPTLSSGLPAGTLRYMSPEHYAGQPITSRSDIFALGLTLYELATGLHPFASRSAGEILHSIATEEVPPLSRTNPALPPQVDSLIRRMLAKDARLRPAAAEVASLLKQTSAPSVAVPRPFSARWRWLAAGSVLLVAVSLGLAWKRIGTKSSVYRLEQLTRLVPENRATAAAISRDGKWMAYANVDGVFLTVIDTGETSSLKAPTQFIIDQLNWLPDSTGVLASGFGESSNEAAVWLLSSNGNHARELRRNARFGAPSPDGTRIAFVGENFSSIWTTDRDGQDAKRLLDASAGDQFLSVVWSADSRYVLFQRRHGLGHQERPQESFDQQETLSFEAMEAGTGHITGKIPHIQVRAATALPHNRIAIVTGAKGREAGLDEVWTVPIDLSTGHLGSLSTKLETPTEFTDFACSFLSASNDGSRFLLTRGKSAESIFVAAFQRIPVRLLNLRRLTMDDSSSYPHAWTRDSQSVIFESNRGNPNFDLYKQQWNLRVPEAVVATRNSLEVLPQLTPDGNTILFASKAASSGEYHLMRVPVQGGTWQELPVGGPLEEFRCSVGGKGRCVLRSTLARSQFVFSELDPERGVGRELARTAWSPSFLSDWDISPDGRFVIMPNHDFGSAHVRVVDLNQEGDDKEREVNIPGLSRLSVVTWAADGSGWFISFETTVGRRMSFYDLRGTLTSLGDVSGWAVPSPDGKKVAFLNRLMHSNAWMMTQP